MYTISCETHFDAAHFLLGYQGKCKNIHGHRWTVRAYISGEALIADGNDRDMLCDFSVLKSELNKISGMLDHKLLTEKGAMRSSTIMMLEDENFEIYELDFRPTAERLAELFFGKLKEAGITPSKIRVYESPDSYAEYSE